MGGGAPRRGAKPPGRGAEGGKERGREKRKGKENQGGGRDFLGHFSKRLFATGPLCPGMVIVCDHTAVILSFELKCACAPIKKRNPSAISACAISGEWPSPLGS